MKSINQSLSKNLIEYLYSLKANSKNEVYETLLLMMLHDDFIEIIEVLIKKNINRIKKVGKNINFSIKPSKEYKKIIDLICKSKYFIKNFTKTEIERKKIIALGIIIEITLQAGIQSTIKGIKINPKFHNVMFPSIEHEIFNDNEIKKIKLTFIDETPLDEIVSYLKDVLEIKNNPKKKKLSLGQSFRIMQIENEIKSSDYKYEKRKYEYTEQIISKEMLNRYKEKLSVEAVSKSLQRIKQIKKEINTILDK